MPSLSYREKSLYASLAAELLVYGPYFIHHRQLGLTVVAQMIFAVIVLQIILQSAIAIFTRNRLTDERDRLIELRGYRAGYLTLASLMVFGLGLLWLHTAAGDFHLENQHSIGIHFINVFFAMLVIADITKTATQIIAYRRAV